jgi:hypothetical protein
MKGLLIVFLAIACASFACGLEIGASPDVLYFNGKDKKIICNEFQLFSSEPRKEFILEDFWALTGTLGNSLLDYTQKAGDLGLVLAYPGNMSVSQSQQGEACLIADRQGIYQGVLLARLAGGQFGVGIRLEAEISGEQTEKLYSTEKNIPLTGKVTNSLQNNLSLKDLIFGEEIFLLFIEAVFILLLLRKV